MITAIAPFSLNMYLPAFTAIAANLHTNVGHVSLSFFNFLSALPAKNTFAGLFIYLFASALCALAQTADILIELRVLHALGGYAGMAASRQWQGIFFLAEKCYFSFNILLLLIGNIFVFNR